MEFCLHTATRPHSDSRDWAGIASVFSVFPHAVTSAAAALMFFFSSLTLCEGPPVSGGRNSTSVTIGHSNKGAEDQ